jgi:hypothetical protein
MSDILVTTPGDVIIDVTPGGDVTVEVAYNPVAGSGTNTNIGVTRTATDVVVTSSSGTDGTILAADGSNAGVFTAADFTKLAAITGTNTGDQFIFKNVAVSGQSTVTAETTNDTLNIVAGTNTTLTTDASTDSITINASNADIGVTRTASSVVVTSSTGTDGTILAADGSNAGVFTATDYTKLAAISGTNTGDQFIFKNVAVAGQSTVTAETTNDTLTLVAGTNVTITTDAGTDSVTINASGGGGSGDVVGPASSTDNAFARFDSTTGKLLQNSTATLDDVGLASLDAVQFDTTPTTAVGEAKAVWDATNSCLSIGLNSSVTSLVGTDSHVQVYNESASTMTVMQVVRQSGSSGTRLSVELAMANTDANSANSIGVVAQTISSNSQGFIQTAGLLQGVNTNAFNEGDTLWLSAVTAGLITNVKPTAPNHGVRIGYCIKKAGGAGIILIDILNGFELDELHDVKITTPIADNSFLTYDTASSVWLNEAPSAAKSSIGLSNVTNDAQTKAAVVPNTAPSAGQVLVGNAGGTAYAPVSASGDATLASTGALTLATVNANTGAFGSATVVPIPTFDAKGRATSVSSATITPAVGSITGLGTGVATALATNVGSAGAPVLLDGAGGTPSSLTLTNATGLPVAGITSSTSTALGVGSLELGNASDTTLARSSAGNVTVEGNLLYRAGGSFVGMPFEYSLAVSDETTALTTGTAKVTFRMPCAVTLTAVRASVTTAPTGSTLVVDINEAGASILSTKLSIDASEKTSTTAATAAVISDSALADDAEMTIDIDQIGSTIAGTGLKVTLIGTRA